MPLCSICKLDIPEGALKCTKCDSYQGWRRYLNFSSLVLSLLVALLSVAGLTLPSIIDALRPHRSHFFVNIAPISRPNMRLSHYWDMVGQGPLPESMGKDGEKWFILMPIVITNSGNASGTVTEISFRGLVKAQPNGYFPLHFRNEKGVPIVIAPGTTTVLEGYYQLATGLGDAESSGSVELLLRIVDSGGKNREESTKLEAIAKK